MKRYVKAASAKYSSEDFKTIAEEVDSTLCDSDAAEAILRADKTGLLETFATSISVPENIELSGDTLIPHEEEGNIYFVHGIATVTYKLLPLRKNQVVNRSEIFYFGDPIKVDEAARGLARHMRKTLNVYYKRYEEFLSKQALKDRFNTEDTKLISAFSVACRYVKKYANLTPTFRYSDTGTALYMLWSLPNVEIEHRMLDEDALQEHEDRFRDALARFEEDTGVPIQSIYCPHEGNYVRAAFEFTVDPKIQLVHNKKDDTYHKA